MEKKPEAHFSVKLQFGKPDIDTPNPHYRQRNSKNCTPKDVLHLPFPCLTTASHFQI